MPKRPDTCEVYGRIGKVKDINTHVVDIGSGDCTKLAKFIDDLCFDAVDPEVTNHREVMLRIHKMTIEQFLDESQDLETVLMTSFMSVCQLNTDAQKKVLKFDGIHLVPDHDSLLKDDLLTFNDGKYCCNASDKVYYDFPIVTDCGYRLQRGYLLLASYANKEFKISVDRNKREILETCSFIDASPISLSEINIDDVDYKFDGVPYEVICVDGTGYIVDRASKAYRLKINTNEYLRIHLEFLGCVYVLTRVVGYRAMLPPHCGDLLRHFAEKIKIKIDDVPVVGPLVYRANISPIYEVGGELIELPTNGIITRIEERDYYTKHVWTLDLMQQQLDELVLLFESLSLKYEIGWHDGLCEYAISRDGSVITLYFVREKHDKLVPMSMETVHDILQKTTTSDFDFYGFSNLREDDKNGF